MFGLFQCMAKQPFSVASLVRQERERRKTAQGGHVTGIVVQHFAHNPLGCFSIVGHEGSDAFLYELSLRIREPGPVEGNARVAVLLKIDQYVAIGKPCEMMMRHLLQYPAQLLSCIRYASIASVSASQIHPRVGESRLSREYAFEHRDAVGDSVLMQQRGAQ